MEELEHFLTESDPLLACSMCRCLLREAVLLKCLHNCCRQCFCKAASKDGCSDEIGCGLCGVFTRVGSEQPNAFMDSEVKQCTAAEFKACDKCNENGEHDKAALVWCPTCRHWLCDDCMAVHRLYYRQHVTQSLEELESLDEVCSQQSAVVCGIHGKPLDIVCRRCEEAKCTSCWASCKEEQHEVYVISENSFDCYVSELISRIPSMESELLRKSAVLEKPQIVLQNIQAARRRHEQDLKKRKQRVMEAAGEAYDKMLLCTQKAYDDIEADGVRAAEEAERIASNLSDVRSYIRRLLDSRKKCEIFKQQKILRERLSSLSADLENLNKRMVMPTSEVIIDYLLPENVEDVIRTWIGKPCTYPDTPDLETLLRPTLTSDELSAKCKMIIKDSEATTTDAIHRARLNDAALLSAVSRLDTSSAAGENSTATRTCRSLCELYCYI